MKKPCRLTETPVNTSPRLGRPLSLAASSTLPGKTESQSVTEWEAKATLLIKTEMAKRRWGYRELAIALQATGIRRSATVLNRRINRGNFSAGFLLACLHALEAGQTTPPQGTRG